MELSCVVFDLDGTLVDSRADIADALDRALVERGFPPVGRAKVDAFVGDGARMLVARALGGGAEPAIVDDVLARFMLAYRANHLANTTLYPGAEEVLEALASRGVRSAVVSNKPHEFTESLLRHLGVARWFDAVLGGDSLFERKPHPAPLLVAVARCGATPDRAAIVGDGDADMAAGRAAGMRRVGCTFGFRPAEELRSAGAEVLVDSLFDLLAALDGLE